MAKLLTKAIEAKLRANHQAQKPVQGTDKEIDHKPAVKFFTPDANCTWLLTELQDDGDTLFGLCDLGLGEPELGYVSLAELQTVRGKLGLPVERDRWFTADKPLSQYADEARARGGIRA
jgi:hypothetical protein